MTESGKPVNETRKMVFQFFNNSTCSGSPLQSITKDNVPVSSGLFQMSLDVNKSHFNGQSIWLRINVGGVNLGCEEILAVPHALILRPEAVIQGSGEDLDSSTLLSINNGIGRGIYGIGSNVGVQGTSNAALEGIGVYGTTTAQYGAGVIGDDSSGHATGISYGVLGKTSYSVKSIPVAGFQSAYSVADLANDSWRPGGLFGGMDGVVGITKEPGGYAVFSWDKSSCCGYAGFFKSENGNGVGISTKPGLVGLSVMGGIKSAVVATEDGSRLSLTKKARSAGRRGQRRWKPPSRCRSRKPRQPESGRHGPAPAARTAGAL